MIKYLIFAFNFIFLLSGVAIITVGALIDSDYTEYATFIPPSLSSAPIILIVVGCIIFVIAFFGCCGAMKESYCLTITFSLLLGLVFILEIAAGVTAFVSQDSFQDELYSSMNQTLNQVKSDPQDYQSTLKSWTSMQSNLKCCGVDSYTDWRISFLTYDTAGLEGCACTITTGNPNNCVNVSIPISGTNMYRPYFADGCYTTISNFINDNLIIVGGVGIGLAFIQIMGVICACCLASAIKEEH